MGVITRRGIIRGCLEGIPQPLLPSFVFLYSFDSVLNSIIFFLCMEGVF